MCFDESWTKKYFLIFKKSNFTWLCINIFSSLFFFFFLLSFFFKWSRTYGNSSWSKNGFRIYNIFVRRIDGIVYRSMDCPRVEKLPTDLTDTNKYLCVRGYRGDINETYFRRIRGMHQLQRKYATMFRMERRFQCINEANKHFILCLKQMFELKFYIYISLFIFIFYGKYTRAYIRTCYF